MADTLFSLLQTHKVKTPKQQYISQEFQDFAYRLAMALSNPDDRQTISMCMRLVKTKPRGLLEAALQFVSDAPARNKIALFLWKLRQIEAEAKDQAPPAPPMAEQQSLLE